MASTPRNAAELLDRAIASMRAQPSQAESLLHQAIATAALEGDGLIEGRASGNIGALLARCVAFGAARAVTITCQRAAYPTAADPNLPRFAGAACTQKH
jgi:hypothetical protein